MDLLAKYSSHFNEIPQLYPEQERALASLIAGRNTLAIIPTGGGKSLIYQLLALDLSGITIVVSPLIALMQEQVKDLESRGISALALNSNIPFDEQREILRNLSTSEIKLLYLSPERLQNGIFRASIAASGVQVSMVAIDEAHCISQWGQGFRPDYAQIGPFIKFLRDLGHNPISFALTATLSEVARVAIRSEFDIDKHGTVLPQSVLRENLVLEYKQVRKEEDKECVLHEFLREYKPKKALIYLYSKPKCEKFAELFLKLGYSAAFYHADLEKQDKAKVYDNFVCGNIEILFATTAFGMGINIPDIDAVIHVQIPNSVEEYYQHVGRGWRNKMIVKDCHCLAIWSDTNFDRRSKDLAKSKYSIDSLKKIIGILLGKVKANGQVIAKDKEEYLNAKWNLPLIRYKLEEKGIIETIGEINGSPMKIKMRKDTELWRKLLQSLDGIDSFIWGTTKTDITITDVIDHLYEQEYAGNIKKLPARQRELYFRILDVDPTELVLEEIVSELNLQISQAQEQLDELKQLFTSSNPEAVIQRQLS